MEIFYALLLFLLLLFASFTGHLKRSPLNSTTSPSIFWWVQLNLDEALSLLFNNYAVREIHARLFAYKNAIEYSGGHHYSKKGGAYKSKKMVIKPICLHILLITSQVFHIKLSLVL